MSKNSIHWFRKDTVRCVYFLDPWFAGSSNLGVNRWRFLLQCLEDLDTSLRKLNSRLFVIRGQPANIFPRLFKDWNISQLTFECDSEPFGKERDAAIKKLATEAGVEVVSRTSHTLYDLDKIMALNGGHPPLTFKRFQMLVGSMLPPDSPVEALSQASMGRCVTPVLDNHTDKYGVPLLEELGFDTDGLAPAVWPGGESEALTRVEKQLRPDLSTTWQVNFERPRNTASPLLPSPLGLSPYLRFGCLSCRLFYSKLAELYNEVKMNNSPPISLYNKLLWREFFCTAATNNPRFDKMEGNPICIRIPWDRNAEALAKWAEAKTGFPGSTREDIVNAGSWLCHSCSSFFQQFFHCYCPVGFGRKIDPEGDFIRRYLPVLKDMPDRYIYDPWNAPIEVQSAARCVVGVDYPKPMVNHAEASRLNIERMRQIYQQLSRYRGLGKYFSPSLSLENRSVIVNGEEQMGPRGVRPRPGPIYTQNKTRHGCGMAHTEQAQSSNQELCRTGCAHDFAVPQYPGYLVRGQAGCRSRKRRRELEQEVVGGNDSLSYAFKLQRHNKQKSTGQQDERMAVSS
uniref:Cryptochrome circadian regulator 3b n=1 Tax=Oncorhynchus mykiss TaxID=8022 RepID=A0A8K9UVW1_ONCMY